MSDQRTEAGSPDRGTGRERILRAAAEVFAERGYEGARVQEIARRAGMTTGAIYAHFSGRHELLLAATELHVRRTAAQEQLDASADAPVADIVAAIGAQMAADPDLGMRPMALEALVASRREPELRELMRHTVEASNDELAALVERGQAEGAFAPDLDADTVARFFNTVLVGVAALAPVWGSPLSEQAWTDLLTRILRGLAPDETA
jgi:AcrR family transcriptional regulator